MKNIAHSLNALVDGMVLYFGKENLFWQILCAATFMVFVIPVFYILLTLSVMILNQELASPFFNIPVLDNFLLFLHVILSIPPIMLGPWMFNTALRNEKPDLHRQLGKLYVFGCLLGAVTVFPLAVNNRIGIEPKIGFGVMAVLWGTISYFAYSAAINKDFVAHRRWMMRSFAMTFAFVHVNLTYKFLLPYELLSHAGVKVFQSMISWMFNLFVVEIYLAATTHIGRFVGFKRWMRTLFTRSKLDKFYFSIAPPKKSEA